MQVEPLLQRTIQLLPQPGDLTPGALREQFAENAVVARKQGGRGPAGNSRLTATAAVVLLVLGPSDGWIVGLHKASFVVWLAAIVLHVLGHVLRVPGLVSADYRGPRAGRRGSLLRQSGVALALVGGLILAVATLQYAAPWLVVLG